MRGGAAKSDIVAYSRKLELDKKGFMGVGNWERER